MDPVSASQLRSLHRDLLGIQWLQGLANSGLRRSMCPEAAEAYARAEHIHNLDDAIQDTYALEQLYFPLPKGWWIWVPMLYGFGFLWALRQDSFEGRLFTWGWSMQVFGVFAAWVLFTKAYREHRAKAEKRRRRPLLREERVQAMNDLEALRDQCITICAQGEIPLVD